MPQTPSAIPSLSPRPASQAVVKPLSQPSNDQAKAFATLLDVETRTKAKKRSASSAADAQDDPAPSQSASSEPGASNQPNSGQLIPASVLAGSLSSYIPLSSAEMSVSATSVTASRASAEDTGIATPGSATGAETDSAWQLSNSAVLVRSETHFAPEATAGSAVPSLTATRSPPQNQAEATGQADLASLQQQLASEPPTPDGDPATGGPASSVPNLGSSVAPSKGRRATSDGSAKDTASHRDQYSSPATATPAESQQALEAGASLASEAGGGGSPAQQILDGIQRAVSSSSTVQVSTDMAQTTLDGQQPLKTITLALSPPSLGNVAVELSLKNGKLGIQLQAQEPGTVQLLRQDSALEKLLESAGYSVQNLSVQLAPQASQLAQTAHAAPNAQNFSGQFNSGGSGQQQGNSQSYNGQSTSRHQEQGPGNGRTEDLSGGGSLYV